MDRWHELAGYARIEPIESAAAVSRYVSKYVVKGGEIDMGGPLVPPTFPSSPRQLPGQVVTRQAARQVLSRLAQPPRRGMALTGSVEQLSSPLLAGKRPTLTS